MAWPRLPGTVSFFMSFTARSTLVYYNNVKRSMARSIAKKIEDTLDYPGQIKVNVIRESRAVEYAK